MPFEKGKSGNPHGKPTGAKSFRTKQWEALHESIVGEHAEQFNLLMNDLWNDSELKNRITAGEMYLQVLEYFKPKHARVSMVGEEGAAPIQIVISDKV